MSTPNNTLQERASEIRAHALCEMTVKLLAEYIAEPSGKRFTRNRALRIERWRQLAIEAEREARGLEAIAKAPRKAVKPRVTPTDTQPQQAAPAAA